MESEQSTVNLNFDNSKWMIKGLVVGLIALLLLIPMTFVKDLVLERQERQKKVTSEITGKSAERQSVIGPILVLPYRETDSTGKTLREHTAYFLPDTYEVNSTITPRKKYRGIYKVMFYDAVVEMYGRFGDIPLSRLGIEPGQVDWQNASVILSLADNRGLLEQPNLVWKGSPHELTPEKAGVGDRLVAPLKVAGTEDLTNAIFSTTLRISGFEQLLFTPVGKNTSVKINSTWKDPSFTGNILPQSSEIGKNGFSASWSSMSHARNFPQYWTDRHLSITHQFPAVDGDSRSTQTVDESSISSAAFGVNLFIHINGYQKTLRSIKYALLCILLTFATFFLIEMWGKTSAHPFQYGLVGLALVLFYTLLLSVSEYTGFNIAYLVATLATVTLIGWFAKGVLRSSRLSVILSVVLVLVYTYVFTLMNLQDYSLLLGSIGLFAVLAVIMKFTSKLNWP